MANRVFNVNTDAAIIFTAKLERLNKSAFPSAIRSSLNDASFAMKQKEILGSAKSNMTVRNPSFFKKFTGVKRATGFDVNSMYSEVGFKNTDPNPIKGKKAIEGMESNEVGGSDSTGAMYLRKARTSNSLKKLVRRKSRFDKSKVLNSSSKSNVAKMYASAKSKQPVFIGTSKGRFLVQATTFSRGTNGGPPKIKLDFLMRDRKKHKATAKATHFNKEAAINTSKQIEGFYAKNANFQFNKILKSTR